MSGGPAGRRLPVTAGRPWPAWVLAAVAVLVGGAAVLGGVQMIRNGYFFLQPVIAVLGLAETGLAWLWQRAGDRRSGHNRDLRP